jgi:hypothetical protein
MTVSANGNDLSAPLTPSQRGACWLIGILSSGGGVAAIFVKNNGAGAALMLLGGLVFLLMAVTGSSIKSLTFPGGGGVQFRSDAATGAKIRRAAEQVKDEPAVASQAIHQATVDALKAANVPDPEEKAKTLGRIWVELDDFVDELARYLDQKHVQFYSEYRRYFPRIVATAAGANYGLYVMASHQQNPQWVEWAISASRRVKPRPKPVLVLEVEPNEVVRAAASEKGVALMWRDAQGDWQNAPWQASTPEREDSPSI